MCSELRIIASFRSAFRNSVSLKWGSSLQSQHRFLRDSFKKSHLIVQTHFSSCERTWTKAL